MGYFTKWGDGAYDFNPIADLTVTEIYEFLTWLHAPENIIRKAPSAGLFEGQTDEQEMGVTYAAIDKYILTGEASEHDIAAASISAARPRPITPNDAVFRYPRALRQRKVQRRPRRGAARRA